MFRYHALGGASMLVLGGSLFALPSPASAPAPDGAAGGDGRRAPADGGQTRSPQARSVSFRPPGRRRGRPAASAAPAASLTAGITPSVARARLYQAPTGQTETTIDRSQFDNRPAFSVGDVLRDSPGISVKQGNGPRDIGISIRGSNARNGFGIRNLVIFDDGFPVTQPDGLSRSDLIDPRAYGAIDVIRGPSSALYGNYATGGALNFRTRPGGTIDGVEYGVDGGSFGYLNNYLAAGKKVGNFEGSLFASDARGDGFIGNSWFNTQTVNFLGTLQATPDDRFTVKFINNDLEHAAADPAVAQPVLSKSRSSRAARPVRTAAPGCGTVTLFNNGFNAAAGTDTETAVQAGLGRDDRRTIVGGRWEHDFDNTTTWRNQFVFDDRNISQPTGATSAIGDFPVLQLHERRHQARRNSRHGFDDLFRRLLQHADSVERYAQRDAGRQRDARPSVEQSLQRHDELRRARAGGTQAHAATDRRRRHRMGNDPSEGNQHGYTYSGLPPVTDDDRRPTADRQFQNTAPELALLYKLNHRVAVPGARRHRIRHAAGLQPLRSLERSDRQQHAAPDAEEPRLRPRLRLDAEQRAEIERDRFL